ncbi:MAG: hypothetical protein RLZZ387_2243 [Chloroflexota bacterium]
MLIPLPLDDDTPLPAVPEHQPVELICPAPPDAPLELAVDGRPLDPFLRPGDPAWRWRWNPGAAVGLHELRLRIAGPRPSEHTWRLRVAPAKIDEERYALLLEDIEHLAAGLAFTLAGAGTEGASPSPASERRPGPAEQYYALFEERLDALERAAQRILARPREQLRHDVAPAPLGGPAAPDGPTLASLPRGELQPAPPGLADELQRTLTPQGGLLPTSLPAPRAAPTIDTYEHRLLKRLLALLAARARRIEALAARLAARLERAEGPASVRRQRANQIAAGCADAARRLRELRAAPPLAEVGPLPAFRGPTPLIQRDPAYREVYRTWLALHQQPLATVDTPLLDIPIADLPHLYESWCALQVAQALASLGAVREQRLVAASSSPDTPPDDLEHGVALVEGQPLLTVSRGDLTLALRYQPRYRPQGNARRAGQNAQASPQLDNEASAGIAGSAFSVQRSAFLVSLDRHTRVPDLAIELSRPGAPPRVLVLDAKYRLDGEGGVPQDALADAYAYLGAIGSAGERATVGSVILFPGRGAPERYSSGVSALPLLPGAEQDLAAFLAACLGLDIE